jgi:multidrug efflux pump subunit AcrB
MTPGTERQLSPLAALIRFFVHHATAANLLLVLLVMIGLLALNRINTQFFPDIDIPRISVRVTWAGATPADMERTVIRNLEPVLRTLDGLEDFWGVAREGFAYISLRFRKGTDMRRALEDVRKAVDSVSTLPADADEPVVQQVTRYEIVGKILVTGPYSEATLRDHARRLRDGLLEAGIERVTLSGARRPEVIVELPQRELVRLDKDVNALADLVRRQTEDIPAGEITGGLDRTIHAESRPRTPAGLAGIVIRAGPDGEEVRIGDFGRVRLGFDPDAERGFANGRPAVQVIVWRTPSADTLKTAAIMLDYLKKVRPTLPPDLELTVFDLRSRHVKARIWMLLENGIQGLVLVLIVLFLFLNGRIAFWVAAGIPVSLMAALAMMWLTGQTINMVSLFALILTLGIIVDDAIVVGEHTATLREKGLPPALAAEQGALRMLSPVMAASLTTIAAFLPLFFFQGRIGAIIVALPLVVISVLVASLIECFLILPAHLRHALRHERPPSRFRRWFDARFAAFRDGLFNRAVSLAYDWRYATWAFMILLLAVSVALAASGRIRFNFFPAPEAEFLQARIIMAAGTPERQTLAAIEQVEQALRRVEKELGRGERLVEVTFARVGKMGYSRGDHLAQLDVQLTSSEERSVRTRELLRAWRRALPRIPGVERITFGRRHAASAPSDLEIELKGDDPFTLKQAAGEIATLLKRIPGVQAVSDDLPWGRPDVRVSITPRGRALGFDEATVARQVRAALRGAIARTFARNLEEWALRVKRSEKITSMAGLEELYVRSATGVWLPLADVAELRVVPGFSVIYRRDGHATMSVMADLDTAATSISEVTKALHAGGLDAIVARHGIRADIAGGAEEQRRNLGDLRTGTWVALILIYLILAWIFGSYTRPLVIMTVIPFGAIGAIFGHWIMGYALTILSLIGLLGLSGIIINDSIILVSRAMERLGEGEDIRTATIGAARDRLRAVVLTSLTTVGGLTPLMFERSLQAQFLLPMAITIVFGLAAATLVVLFLVPATLGILGDAQRLFRRLLGRAAVPAE